jgi:hypothetical protein
VSGEGALAQLRGDTRDGSVSAGQGIIRKRVIDISLIVKRPHVSIIFLACVSGVARGFGLCFPGQI